ncbi:restriction endonuclease [Helicobacter pylori]|uniref:restriction endonuclease n=1 Tax=Helicobacter pylori TaxID=210 RepID=UPI000EADA2F2|nr:restriction endonuclease [Helicobacter pylori]RKV31241.1 restriction endonuclease [Helicobacter pylori]
MVPTQLNEIAEFLRTNPYHLSQPLRDGRLNSSVNEEEILNTIKHSFPIQLPKAREWWDFSFEEKDLGKNTNRDYYFLIINKNDPKDIFINSLKGIQTLQPNNLPFQCKWDNNREIVQRDFIESKNFILSALAKSVKLRANIY